MGLAYEVGIKWKVVGIIGIIAIIVLALIIASPHVKPLQLIARSLGLVQTQTIYVPVNHTVYVNQTIVKYVNQTVPVYINRTVYVYVPTFNSSDLNSLIEYVGKAEGTGWCWARLIALPNGTVWLVNVWIAPVSLARVSGLFKIWPYSNWNSTYGIKDVTPYTFPIVVPINNSLNVIDLETSDYVVISNATLNYPMPNYTVVLMATPATIFVVGNRTGFGPTSMMELASSTVSNGELQLMQYYTAGIVTIGNELVNATLPLNRTYFGYMPALASWTYFTEAGQLVSLLSPFNDVLVPCRVDVIYVANPQLALNITVPYPDIVSSYFGYWHIGEFSPSGDPYATTFGYWIWGVNATPINITW
ncbi:hypothetical protein [Vulcanisaeta distributa]|uniref:Uncharacterized protein n=1 Tax=Vulcanisaeta distributa (strain DSM 14429 / JCM 11212 / NBRC 100878 / IC-017) TaxID=572478 RepID=E1QS94_VULDI|nr:hypothetical protein [Vulcanisaeta distributa]ADN49487.1 hypothetical protein Vdis_0072 [Vulcanisaeta distributa DSM 14429]